VANAAATEIAATDVPVSTEEKAVEATNGLANANVSDDAANAVAESHWDGEAGLSASQEWVDVKIPRDPLETETGLNATPAATANTQSWADEQPEPVKPVSKGTFQRIQSCCHGTLI
jgi:hypothetical protein